ncbi:MAG: zinc-ribbon domain-containing protein [Salibacteraceae bacterium]
MGATVKGSVQEMQLLAKSRGGICWSKVYVNSKTNLWWECINGHRWQATPFSIKNRKSWCPVCARNTPLGLEYMKKIAKQRDGKCLSKNYSNVKTKLLWRCSEGHQFEATPDNVRKGAWCGKCKSANDKRQLI